MKTPNSIQMNGKRLNFAGSSNTPGGVYYVDHGAGNIMELFPAQITNTGPHFSLATITANPHLGTVKIPAASFGQPPAVGGHYLVGPLSYPEGRPAASHAFPLPENRVRGIIGEIKAPKFGYIFANGNRYFVHANNCAGGVLPPVGVNVTFTAGSNERGPLATHVRIGQ